MRFSISQGLYQEPPPLEPWSLEPPAVTQDNYQAAANYMQARIMPRFPEQPYVGDGWDLDDKPGGEQMDRPHPETLLAACEGMAMLIRHEYGDGPMSGDVATFTEASVEQIAAVATMDAYWAAAEAEPDAVTSLVQGYAHAREHLARLAEKAGGVEETERMYRQMWPGGWDTGDHRH